MKTRILLVVLALISVAVLAACGAEDHSASVVTRQAHATETEAPAARAGDDQVLATVNGRPITQAQLDSYAQERAMHQPMVDAPQQRQTVLQELINLEIIRQEAERQGLDRDPAILADLENQRRTILAGAAVREHIEADPISDEALEREYRERVAGLDLEEYKARHILVRTEEEAREITAALDEGADFAALADERSIDPSGEGGDLGWFSPQQMVEPFAQAVQQLEPGSYTREPVQTEFGWHVVLVEDTREVEPPPFEEMKERVRHFMQNQQINEYIVRLREQAEVAVHE
jgi:peptidyl-prolyl cis-trans isomerase C